MTRRMFHYYVLSMEDSLGWDNKPIGEASSLSAAASLCSSFEKQYLIIRTPSDEHSALWGGNSECCGLIPITTYRYQNRRLCITSKAYVSGELQIDGVWWPGESSIKFEDADGRMTVVPCGPKHGIPNVPSNELLSHVISRMKYQDTFNK